MKRLLTLLLVAMVTLGMTACGKSPTTSESSGEWPTEKNIEIICPAGAGSATDAISRALASHWGEMFPDHNFNVINDATGGYTIAYEMGRNSKSDGSRILVGTPSMLLTYYFGTYDHLVTDPEEFQIINCLQVDADTAAIFVKADSPYETIDDLIKDARENPNTLSVGTGAGSIVYGMGVSLEDALGVEFRKVDGADNNERISNVLGGFNDFAFLTPAVGNQYVESGDMRMLAYLDNESSVNYPNIPNMAELGYPLRHKTPAGYILCANPDMSEDLAEAISDTLRSLPESKMWMDVMDKVFKGSWEFVEREKGIQIVKDMEDFCVDLKIGQ